jgi:PTS system cellobiose-specific IIC component
MSKFDRKTIVNKINPLVNKIQTSKLVNGITGGMMGAMPITILGAFAALLLNLPVPGYKEFIADVGIASVLKIIIMFTTNFLAVIFAVAIAGNYAKQHEEDGLFCGILTLICFFIVTPVTISSSGAISVPMQWMGGLGSLLALL